MVWVFRVAGVGSVVGGALLLFAWFLLGSPVAPDGRKMFAGPDVDSLAAFGVLLIVAGVYLARAEREPGD